MYLVGLHIHILDHDILPVTKRFNVILIGSILFPGFNPLTFCILYLKMSDITFFLLLLSLYSEQTLSESYDYRIWKDT